VVSFASGSYRLILEKEPLEDRRGDSLAVDLVRPAFDALSNYLHFGHRTILERERWGRTREAPSTVASRTRHPDSRYVSDFLHRHMSLIVPRRTMVDGVLARCQVEEPLGVDRMSRAKTTIRFAAE
jgi:hypothetical protein